MNKVIGNLNGMNYGVFYPDNYENLPLIVYLHGAGERGENSGHIFRYGLAKYANEGREYNAIILCPQCPAQFVWDGMVKEVKGIIDHIAEEYKVNKKRIYITGSSMGGFGTWSMALTYPNFFAAAAPVCGGGMGWRAGNLKTTPVKTYHGLLDKDVLPVCSEMMVEAVNRCGGSAQLVKYNDLGHNDCIDFVYKENEIIDWLLKHERTTDEVVKEALYEFF